MWRVGPDIIEDSSGSGRGTSVPLAAQLRRKHKEKQEAPSQDVLKATIMTLVALKNKQTRRSTCETATTVRVKRLQQQTGPDWTRTHTHR